MKTLAALAIGFFTLCTSDFAQASYHVGRCTKAEIKSGCYFDGYDYICRCPSQVSSNDMAQEFQADLNTQTEETPDFVSAIPFDLSAQKSCTSSRQCSSGMQCIAWKCVPKSSSNRCDNGAHRCSPNERCVNGVCRPR